MKICEVQLSHCNYPVYAGKNILEELPGLLTEHDVYGQMAIISNPTVWRLYGEYLQGILPGAHYILVPDSEKAKSAEELQHLYTELLEKHFERSSTILAFGGGVVGDLAGYLAATYLRGVKLVQLPTTLLAQVDSSIGGKVGINHPRGKNLIGAFKHPLFVCADTSVLSTLTKKELRCGLGEVIKYAFIGSPGLFDYLEKNLDAALASESDVLAELVRHSVAQKAAVVEKDEKESGLRMTLNFGHTFGHALEAEFAFSGISHGEAVILGMRCALYYGHKKGLLKNDAYERGMALLKRVPVRIKVANINPEKLLHRIAFDKKVKDGKIRLVLITDIGNSIMEEDADEKLISEAFSTLS